MYIHEPYPDGRVAAQPMHNGQVPTPPMPEIVTVAELSRRHPRLREPLIEGVLRLGETMNVISASKIGKSWLIAALAVAIATGRRWLDTFATAQGRVLIIDNELHPETLAYRLRKVAEAYGLALEDLPIDVVCLRGQLLDVFKLKPFIESITPGTYKLVIIDAFYRSVPAGTDENDNGMMANIYNHIDAYASHLQASFALIHHSSKGNQAEKAITDVGSGAGSMSRATDTHLILRPHEKDKVVVLDAVVRSFAPVTPICLLWDYPIWQPADEDPTLLRKPKPRANRKSTSKDEKPEKTTWTARHFANVFGKPEPRLQAELVDDARLVLADRKVKDLLKDCLTLGYLFKFKDEAGRDMISITKPTEPATPETPPKPKKRTIRQH
jgi:hypothetical protein